MFKMKAYMVLNKKKGCFNEKQPFKKIKVLI